MGQGQLCHVREQRDDPEVASASTHCRLHDSCRQQREARETIRREDRTHKKSKSKEGRNEDSDHRKRRRRGERRGCRISPRNEQGSSGCARDRHPEPSSRERRPKGAAISQEKERDTGRYESNNTEYENEYKGIAKRIHAA